jgi:hypothetical protein
LVAVVAQEPKHPHTLVLQVQLAVTVTVVVVVADLRKVQPTQVLTVVVAVA